MVRANKLTKATLKQHLLDQITQYRYHQQQDAKHLRRANDAGDYLLAQVYRDGRKLYDTRIGTLMELGEHFGVSSIELDDAADALLQTEAWQPIGKVQ